MGLLMKSTSKAILKENLKIQGATGPAGLAGGDGPPGLPGVPGEMGARGFPGNRGFAGKAFISTCFFHLVSQPRLVTGYQTGNVGPKAPGRSKMLGSWSCIALAQCL